MPTTLAHAESDNGPPDSIQNRLRVLESQLAQLLSSPAIKFDDRCRSALPEAQGIYRIFDPKTPDQTVRAGSLSPFMRSDMGPSRDPSSISDS